MFAGDKHSSLFVLSMMDEEKKSNKIDTWSDCRLDFDMSLEPWKLVGQLPHLFLLQLVR